MSPSYPRFDEALAHIRHAASKAELNLEGIITSKSPGVEEATKALTVEAPRGFRKWQLPVYLDGPAIEYLTVADPGASVGRHSHQGDGIRYIMSGSIIFNGTELTTGDWMYIPANVEYAFETGRFGAVMSSKYQCCCETTDEL
ncbi:cupin domain-containing protein [Streptomyces sp. NPDC048696]|uniref:cupin domain-containing protein n=1 Tax=Streptomyces sp. NPDC048696 TaxID=3365585 RepID=UPI0037148B45